MARARRPLWLLIVGIALTFGCTTQMLHFMPQTGTTAVERLPALEGPWSGQAFAIREVRGGPYPDRPFEWSKVVWHSAYYRGFGAGLYEGFNRLPVRDVDALVASAVAAALRTAGMRPAPPGMRANYEIDIEVHRLFLKTNLRESDSYRACLARLELSVAATDSDLRLSDTVEGTAKFPGANTRPVGRTGLRYDMEYYEEGPNVMAVAVGDAVRAFLEATRGKWTRR